jgi:sugar phosphate isomerase/epimerase
MHRRTFLASSVAGVVGTSLAIHADEPVPRSNLGLLLYSYGIRARSDSRNEFAQPANFLSFAHERGANAVQLALGIRDEKDCLAIRRLAEKREMAIEGIVAPPKGTAIDRERFDSELKTAQACGAAVMRMVMLGGRRYEVFQRAEDYLAFAKRAATALKEAEPIAARHKVQLAVENHKDLRIDELTQLIKAISSEWVGICLDTGNNLALLEDPFATVTALAAHTRTVHLKDIAFEEAPEGFRMAEVPLGQGSLDLPGIVKTIRQANPKVRFQLEMITRDPLLIPCLQDKYWATLERVSGRDLARTLAMVRKQAVPQPLPRLTKMTAPEQIELEDRQVRESFRNAAKSKLTA